MVIYERKIVTIPRALKASDNDFTHKIPFSNKEEEIEKAIKQQRNFVYVPFFDELTKSYKPYFGISSIIGLLIGITEDSAIIEILNNDNFAKYKNPCLDVNVIVRPPINKIINVVDIGSFTLSELYPKGDENNG